MTPIQCRMARLACGWTAEALAKIAGVSYSGLIHFELSYVDPANSRVAALVQRVLEIAGVEFIGDDAVRFPKSWNRDFQSTMKAYQRELRRLEKLRGRLRRLEARA